MTYPESEIRRVLKERRYSSTSDDELIKAMKSCSDSDRERVRIELWKDMYLKRYDVDPNDAVDDFDKQFNNK